MKVLFIGAHTDDIEHGAGATMVAMSKNPHISIKYITFSLCKDIERNKLIEKDQETVKEVLKNLGINDVSMLDFQNRRLFEDSSEIRSVLEKVRDSYHPDIIYTHWKDDIHQDHKTIADETIRVFRNKTVLSYQCIRSCPNFTCNYYFPIQPDELSKKIELIQAYETQATLSYNLPHVIEALAVTRGSECGNSLAEGFYVTRAVGRILCA